jgi:glycine dehydrogenase subunit 1
MERKNEIIYPYMPNSAPKIKGEMLDFLGIADTEELLGGIPPELRQKEGFRLPKPLLSEGELTRHVERIMGKNISAGEYDSYLGGGCYQHFVPALCDEINARAEFVTAYTGDTYSDHGKNQTIFEFCSQIGELVDMDLVSFTYYDGGQAVCTALRMAGRLTGRREILLPKSIAPDLLSQIRDYEKKALDIVLVEFDPKTGLLNLEDFEQKLSENTAAVFLENPSYLGVMETQAREIAGLTHAKGALLVVCPDVSSLGILEAPPNYGADIVCGEIQPLGIRMSYGGGCAGFIATPGDRAFLDQHTTYLYSMVPTEREGQFGFIRMFPGRTSHGSREKANEYYGTSAALWGITAAVYLACMGPRGMEDLGKNILYRSHYAKTKLAQIPGISLPLSGATFREFVVDMNATGRTVADIHKKLLEKRIFGGKDLSKEFPQFGQSALYCVTEVHDQAAIDRLCGALTESIANTGRSGGA